MQCLIDTDKSNTLFHARIETPIGELICLASEKGISTLLFSDDVYFNNDTSNFTNWKDNKNNHILQLEDELKKYFEGQLEIFQTAIDQSGTVFQKEVWHNLQQIPFGHTITYTKLASNLGSANKIRAVANANSKNCILLLIPCHRVIGEGNKLIGYRGGIKRKRWLINFENNHTKETSEKTLF